MVLKYHSWRLWRATKLIMFIKYYTHLNTSSFLPPPPQTRCRRSVQDSQLSCCFSFIVQFVLQKLHQCGPGCSPSFLPNVFVSFGPQWQKLYLLSQQVTGMEKAALSVSPASLGTCVERLMRVLNIVGRDRATRTNKTAQVRNGIKLTRSWLPLTRCMACFYLSGWLQESKASSTTSVTHPSNAHQTPREGWVTSPPEGTTRVCTAHILQKMLLFALLSVESLKATEENQLSLACAHTKRAREEQRVVTHQTQPAPVQLRERAWQLL